MRVTEPCTDTDTDTTKVKSTAGTKRGKGGNRYGVNDQTVRTSRVQHSDGVILLARTTPMAAVQKKLQGMSVFRVDLRAAERTLIAAQCIGDGDGFIGRVSPYLVERLGFGRPVGQNPGVQCPIADNHIRVESANACSQFHAGIGCADKYDVERKFRETRLCQVAPISTNPILSHGAGHVLGMPRSF